MPNVNNIIYEPWPTLTATDGQSILDSTLIVIGVPLTEISNPSYNCHRLTLNPGISINGHFAIL